MAQQVTNLNNSILDILSESKMDYTDSLSNAFGSALETAVKKTYEKNENNQLANIVMPDKNVSSKSGFSKNTTGTNVDNDSNISKEDSNISINNKENISDEDNVSDDNSSSDDSQDIKDKTSYQDNMIDLVSQYTYVESIDSSDVDLIESEEVSADVENDILQDDLALNISNEDLGKVQVTLLNNLSNLTSSDELSDNSELLKINISDNLLDFDVEIASSQESSTQDLLSQEMLDEMNVTLEDITLNEDISETNIMTTSE